jgi:hypothetical protein
MTDWNKHLQGAIKNIPAKPTQLQAFDIQTASAPEFLRGSIPIMRQLVANLESVDAIRKSSFICEWGNYFTSPPQATLYLEVNDTPSQRLRFTWYPGRGMFLENVHSSESIPTPTADRATKIALQRFALQLKNSQ